MPAESGNVLAGRYRLSRPLSKGGMSSVWLAHDLSLDVQVAIKLVRVGERSKDPGFAEELSMRLVHEARIIAKIHHPAIVTVIDVAETAEGDPFIVMELLEGEDLETVVRRDGALTGIEAIRHLLPILQGMIAVHEKGVIHRDLKPANVFLAKQDDGRIQPKLLDFGIAKSNRADRLGITRQGETMGSPAYMSPEQVRGDETDERSDVWGACMTLYELISGKLPFERGTHVASMLAILDGKLEPLDCDIDLSLIVRRGLDPEPDARWQTPMELGRELATWLERQGVTHDSAGGSVAAWLTKSNGSTDRPVSIPSAAPVRAKASIPRALAAVAIASLFMMALALGAVLAKPSGSNEPILGAQPLPPPLETPASTHAANNEPLVPPPPSSVTAKHRAEPAASEPAKPARRAPPALSPTPTPTRAPTPAAPPEPSSAPEPETTSATPSLPSPSPPLPPPATSEPTLDPVE